MTDIRKTIAASLRLYFAPLIGAFRHMRGILGVTSWIPKVRREFLGGPTPETADVLHRYLQMVNDRGGQLILQEKKTGARARIVFHDGKFEALPASLE